MEENSPLMESANTIFLFSETNTKKTFFSIETPVQKGKNDTYYLLAGSGAVIFMLLVIIVIQTCRNLKSANRNHQTCDETFKRHPNGHSKGYFSITSSKQSNHFYQRNDPVYHEIDESVMLMQIPPSTDTPNELGDHNLSNCVNNLISNVTEHDDLNAQTTESYALPNTKCTDTDKADYLQPVFVQANIEIESKREAHSYIDVTG